MSRTVESLEVTPESPWLGLHSFGEATQKYFFGRDDELRELFRRVEHKTLTVIFSKSGLGRTSLLQDFLTLSRLDRFAFYPYFSDDPYAPF